MRASKKVKGAVLLTAGAALILGAPTVYADTDTGHNDGLLNGVQALNNVNLNIPVNACGVGALLGAGSGQCKAKAGNDNGGNSVGLGAGRAGSGADTGDVTSSHNHGVLDGLQVGNNLTGNVPVNACGVGALVAKGNARCKAKTGDGNGGNSIGIGRGHRLGHAGNGGDKGDVVSHRNSGLLEGAQVLNNVDLNVPVDLCGVGLLLASGEGDCAAKAGNGNGGNVYGGGYRMDRAGHEWREYRHDGRRYREDRGGRHEWWNGHSWRSGGNGGEKGDVVSSHNSGLLDGLQLLNNLDANVPVTVCGLAVLGTAGCKVHVEAGDRNGGNWGHPGRHAVEAAHTERWENSVLPSTGATGLALLPFGMALVAGGVAMRRRVASQR
jgi:hypothetical protein